MSTPINAADGITLIPVSRSASALPRETQEQTKNQKESQGNAFGGGAGAGVKIDPVAFLVIKDGNVRVISANPSPSTTVDKVIDYVPEVIDKIKEILPKKKDEDADN